MTTKENTRHGGRVRGVSTAADYTRNRTPIRLAPAAGFKRDRLPKPSDYFDGQKLKLIGRDEWKTALCPFHKDTTPSLRVNVETGSFLCHACGTRGGDVLAFHMQRHGLRFIEAAKDLGAWEETQ